MCQGRSADWPGRCHLMRGDGPKRVVSKEEKRCFWEGMLGVRVSMYVRCFHLIFYDHLAHPTNTQDCSARRSLDGQVCGAFRRPELASRFAVTPWQSHSLGVADTLHDGDRSKHLLPCREHTARAAVPPGHLLYPRTTRGHLSCDLTSGQVTEWRRGGPEEWPGADSHILLHNGWPGRIL